MSTLAALLIGSLGMDELDTAAIAAEAALEGAAATARSVSEQAAQAVPKIEQQVASMESLELEITLHILPALLLFAAAGCGVGLVVYFFINLSDLTEDLINPYTLVERINSKLHLELLAHGTSVFALLCSMHPVAAVLSLPGLALRVLWWQRSKLVVDATSIFNPKSQSALRTRWGLMAAWHGVAVLFGFIQCAAPAARSAREHPPARQQ